jgi:membrane protease subunit (stomatin/prohibitin family)
VSNLTIIVNLPFCEILISVCVTDQVNEELDQRLRHLETVLSRMGMIIDSVQSDVMQISRAVKEVLLESNFSMIVCL